MYEVIPETVGQYTGLNDKNGTPIFEKDIIYVEADNKYYLVEYHSGSFHFCQYKYDSDKDILGRDLAGKYCEVVGNLYGNDKAVIGKYYGWYEDGNWYEEEDICKQY